jgi:hypothetical protein
MYNMFRDGGGGGGGGDDDVVRVKLSNKITRSV